MPASMVTFMKEEGNRDDLTFTYTLSEMDPEKREIKVGSFKIHLSSKENCVAETLPQGFSTYNEN